MTIQELEELYALRDALALEKQSQVDQIIPADVAMELEALDAEYQDREDALAARIQSVTEALKAEAELGAATIQGSVLQAVYRKGGKQVSAKDLLDLAARWEKVNPEVASEMRGIVTMRKASVSIEPRKS